MCPICSSSPHQRSCPVRVGPAWRLPPRVEARGGPLLADEPPTWARSARGPVLDGRSRRRLLRDPQARAAMSRRAAELHAAGSSWRVVASELGLPPSTAATLAREAATWLPG